MSEISEKENLQLVLDGKKPAWLPNYGKAVQRIRNTVLGSRKDPVTGYTVDAFGVEFLWTEDGRMPAYTTNNGKVVLKDVTKWKEIILDNKLKSLDWEGIARDMLSNVDRDQKMISFDNNRIWDQFHYLMGFENALMALLEEPEACHDCMQYLANYQIESIRLIYKYLKPDIIMFSEHIATPLGLLMSPRTYREVIKPAHKKAFSAIAELGAIPQIHVDGLIEDVLPDLHEMGVKMLQPFQVFNDINAAKAKYGFTAVGGWDAFGRGNQFDSTEEEVRASVQLAMDNYGPGYRYVFNAGGISRRYPEYNKWASDEAYTYGRTFYHK